MNIIRTLRLIWREFKYQKRILRVKRGGKKIKSKPLLIINFQVKYLKKKNVTFNLTDTH